MFTRLTLFFFKKLNTLKIDHHFYSERKDITQKIFSTTSKIAFVFSLIFGGLRIFGQGKISKEPDLIRISASGFLIVTDLILRKCKRKTPSFAGLFLGLLYLFGMICEYEAQIESDISGNAKLVGAFCLGSMQMFVIFFRLRWYETWVLIIAPQIYFIKRCSFLFEEFSTASWAAFAIFHFLVLFYCIREESYSRIFHKRLLASKRNQEEFFHSLLQDYMPTPLLIAGKTALQEPRIMFNNKSFENLAGTDDQGKMLGKLQDFNFYPQEKNIEFFKRDQINNDLKMGHALNFRDLIDSEGKMNKKLAFLFREYEATLVIERNKNVKSLIPVPRSKTFVLKSFKTNTRSAFQGDEQHSLNQMSRNDIKEVMEESFSNYGSDSFDSDIGEEKINEFSLGRVQKSQETSRRNKVRKKLRYFSVKAGPIFWKDSEATMFIFNEVTESRASANLHAKSLLRENKNRLLSSVSHRLRTHLNAIIGSIETLKSKDVERSSFDKQIKLAWRASQLLYFSIGNLIDLSKIHNNNLLLDMMPVQGLPLLNEVLELVKFRAKLKKIKFLFEIKDLDGIFIVCDKERLKQILLNLFENSIKFTNPGGSIKFTAEILLKSSSSPAVQCSGSSSPAGQCSESSSPAGQCSGTLIFDEITNTQNKPIFVLFNLEDTGQGIPEAQIHSLFDLVYTVSNGVSQASDGVKIGLGLSQYLLHKMLPRELRKEGKIQVKSVPGKGSSFFFKLPGLAEWRVLEKKSIARSPKSLMINGPNQNTFEKYEKNLEKINTPPLSKEEELPNTRLLVVDDDQINHLVLKNYLNKLGMTNYEFANDGLQAFEKFKKAFKERLPFKIIFMDCNMPVMDGYEATVQIRKFEKDHSLRPACIIAVTANVASNDKARSLQAGMNSHLTKPLDRISLRQEMEKYLDMKLGRDETL